MTFEEWLKTQGENPGKGFYGQWAWYEHMKKLYKEQFSDKKN